jgi:hypothetical protein
MMLITYHGVVQDGRVYFRDATELPNGTEVIVVVEQKYPSVEEQEEQLARLTLREWQAPFHVLSHAVDKYPADADIETISDEELVELVHQARE